MYFDTKIRRSIYMYVLKCFPYKTHVFALYIIYMYVYTIYCCVYMFVVCLYYLYDSTNIFLIISNFISCVCPRSGLLSYSFQVRNNALREC